MNPDAIRKAERERIARALLARMDPRTLILTIEVKELHLILGGENTEPRNTTMRTQEEFKDAVAAELRVRGKNPRVVLKDKEDQIRDGWLRRASAIELVDAFLGDSPEQRAARAAMRFKVVKASDNSIFAGLNDLDCNHSIFTQAGFDKPWSALAVGESANVMSDNTLLLVRTR